MEIIAVKPQKYVDNLLEMFTHFCNHNNTFSCSTHSTSASRVIKSYCYDAMLEDAKNVKWGWWCGGCEKVSPRLTVFETAKSSRGILRDLTCCIISTCLWIFKLGASKKWIFLSSHPTLEIPTKVFLVVVVVLVVFFLLESRVSVNCLMFWSDKAVKKIQKNSNFDI